MAAMSSTRGAVPPHATPATAAPSKGLFTGFARNAGVFRYTRRAVELVWQTNPRLAVVLDSGPPYRIGPLVVLGTQRYAPALVENMSPVRPGEDYDRELLVVYQRRLAETGYFAGARAEIDANAPDPAAAPLRVAVIEAPSKQFEAGISYNTDVRARLQLRYSDHDLADSAWRMRSALSLDRQIQEAQLDLDSPPRDEGRFNNWFGRASNKDIQNELARTFSLGVAHNFGTDVAPSAAILSWTLEEQQAGSAPADTRYAVYVGYRRTLRRTDEVVAPRRGYFGSIDLGGAPDALASEDFVRAVGEGSMFFPLGRRGDLALRARAGLVVSDERTGIPTPFLFRTGGDQTVRGYAFESLGVREGDAVVGGRRLFVASAEYTHWLAESWGVATFVDAGNAWDPGIPFEAAIGYGFASSPFGGVLAAWTARGVCHFAFCVADEAAMLAELAALWPAAALQRLTAF